MFFSSRNHDFVADIGDAGKDFGSEGSAALKPRRLDPSAFDQGFVSRDEFGNEPNARGTHFDQDNFPGWVDVSDDPNDLFPRSLEGILATGQTRRLLRNGCTSAE